MHVLEYISYNATQDALRLLKRWSDIIVRNEEQLADALMAKYDSLTNEQRQVFLAEVAEIHPDRQMIEEIITPEKIESFAGAGVHSCNCEYCQMKMGANGQQAVSHFMSNGNIQGLLDNQTLNQEINNIKNEVNTDQKMNDKIFKLVMLGIAVYVLFKITKQ